MTSEKLRALRERLANLDPYPWSGVESWIAFARSLIKTQYPDHIDDFNTITSAPEWYQAIYVVSGGGRYGGRRRDNYAEADAEEERENKKRALNAKQKILAFLDGLLELSPPFAMNSHRDRAIVHHQGDIIMGAKYSSHITGSTVGSVAVGDHATAVGTVSINSGPLTQDQHRTAIKKAQKALLDDEEQLDQLVYEALGQFLRLAREIQVEQKNLAEVQMKMKETLDEVWAENAVKGMKPEILPKTLEVAKVLIESPAMAEVAKVLLGT
jgi:hypothetical protein